jgi:hypothetical protein
MTFEVFKAVTMMMMTFFWEDGFSLSQAWKPLIHDLKEWRQSLTKESPRPMGPETG